MCNIVIMNIPNLILSELETKIKKGLEEKFLSEINTYIVKDRDQRICIVMSSGGNIAVDSAIDNLGGEGLIELLNEISGLTWKAEIDGDNVRLILDDGYIVLSEEIELEFFSLYELYYRVSNTIDHPGMMFESIQYVDGEIKQDADYEPDVCKCDISFQKSLKGEENEREVSQTNQERNA